VDSIKESERGNSIARARADSASAETSLDEKRPGFGWFRRFERWRNNLGRRVEIDDEIEEGSELFQVPAKEKNLVENEANEDRMMYETGKRASF
jgi:hypothetical protein